jgi:hypothetical protein
VSNGLIHGRFDRPIPRSHPCLLQQPRVGSTPRDEAEQRFAIWTAVANRLLNAIVQSMPGAEIRPVSAQFRRRCSPHAQWPRALRRRGLPKWFELVVLDADSYGRASW